ncbi:MAG: mannose-6-phosphate isomerase, class I [Propionibacteriaceae bacterium]|jgi:mannose-6-phosphate isomerase|nr:mannose-6-phosphate isomerase, class I [Propionibacteriaceae bacterium]
MRRLTGIVRAYAWGSPTAIPELLGREPTGEPQAEYWLGAHPLAPSLVETPEGDVELNDYLSSHPEFVGDRCLTAFGDRFPVLMKLLASERPLSLQAHPDREQAEAGFAREEEAGISLDAPERTYRDDWPKPELILALTPFDALCGFRKAADTVSLFERLGVADELASVIGPLTKRKGSAAMAEVFLDILSLDDAASADHCLKAARSHTEDDDDLGEFARTVALLDAYFPGNPGVLAALMLNRVHLEPGEALYLPPRTMHAYLRGNGVEVMACSDNVVRGGLTSKHINVDELIHIVDFSSSTPERTATEDDGGFTRYLAPAPEFAVWRGELSSQPLRLPRPNACRVMLVIDGDATLKDDDDTLTLGVGEAALIPYGEDVTVTGTATVFVGSPGV